MFKKNEFLRNLLGCLEIFLFMPAGINRFSGTREDAIKSFIIPLILLPVTMAVIIAMSSGYSWSMLISLHFVRIVLSFILFLYAVYYLTVQFGRGEHFYRFLNAANWFNIPATLMVTPILFGLIAGYEMAAFESYAIFTTLVGVVYAAFIVTYSFKLPWELGGFIAIVGLAIDQNLMGVALYIRDIVSI